ncbi:MAG TPA: serine/threonine-protein kinase [Kofleriaceae bacterium]|nr:serine/threonine-protein kinase [Kofleriaceae bacterium]
MLTPRLAAGPRVRSVPPTPRDNRDAMAETREMNSKISAPAAPAAVGSRLGRFQILCELGAGGMGIVYAAIDPDLQRRVALKLVRDVANREAKERLLREARAMARLTHPNVVTVYEVGTIGDRDFIAMELIRGESLMRWLRATRPTPAEIVDAFIAAGRGLAAAHAAGIVHRDFKPHNVLRSAAGRVTVTDFGLARQSHDDAQVGMLSTLAGLPLEDDDSLTGHDVVLGTPTYMAPEQWSRTTITPAADQFAYCVALWEALSGERPYVGTTLDDLRARIQRGPAGLADANIPRPLRELLRRGLDPDAGARWPSMDALIARLERTRRKPCYVHALAELGLACVVVSSVITFAKHSAPAMSSPPASLTCAALTADLDAVWSPALADPFTTRPRTPTPACSPPRSLPGKAHARCAPGQILGHQLSDQQAKRGGEGRATHATTAGQRIPVPSGSRHGVSE